jgi:hypothetical protein
MLDAIIMKWKMSALMLGVCLMIPPSFQALKNMALCTYGSSLLCILLLKKSICLPLSRVMELQMHQSCAKW